MMNYLIFDNEIYCETQSQRAVVSKEDLGSILEGPSKDVCVAVIEALQKQVAAPEKDAFRKDEIIASAFSGEYVTQAEQLGANLFQVVAIEKTRLNEIYKRLGFENVRLVVPYAVALREFLRNNNLIDGKKRIVFLDHLKNQVLLTIFNNDVLTTPRRLSINPRRVASELTRSQENYRSLFKNEKEIKFLIVTNNKEIMEEIVSSGLETKDNVVFVDDAFPALTGLKTGKFSMHFLLPEEFIRIRRLRQVKKRLKGLSAAALFFLLFLVFLFLSLASNKNARTYLTRLELLKEHKSEKLRYSYSLKYKDIIRQKQRIDIPYLVDSFVNAATADYRIEYIDIRSVSNGIVRFEAVVSSRAKGVSLSSLKLPHSFKEAKIENILLKDAPAVRIILNIFDLKKDGNFNRKSEGR